MLTLLGRLSSKSSYKMKYFLTSVIFLTTHVIVGYYGVLSVFLGPFNWWTIPALLLLGAVVMATFLLGLVFYHISSQPVSRFHSLPSALLSYVFQYGMLRSGRAGLKKLKVLCGRPREVQEALLRKLLKQNGRTKYGRKYHFAGVVSLTDFGAKHPLTDYDHYRPYIEAMARGERNVLSAEPPSKLTLTSGTTGDAKMVPIGSRTMQTDYVELKGLVEAVSGDTFPDWNIMQKQLWLYTDTTMTESNGGIPMGSLSHIPGWARNLLVIFATPPEGFSIRTTFEATYLHLLFGLRDPGIAVIVAVSASSLLAAMRLLEDEWQRITADLAAGTISSRLDLPSGVRQSLERALAGGNPKRARELQREFEAGFEGIIRRLWPDISYIKAIDGANLKSTLVRGYAKGVPVCSNYYGATESIIGLNITPLEENDEFLLLIDFTVFEFIPEREMSKPNPKIYFIDELDAGQNYEVVVTVHDGLYRYRLGDVVQVTGFYKECPKVKFLYRSGVLLNICGEKMNQSTVYSAVKEAVSKLPVEAEMIYYAVAESTLLSGSRVNLKECGDNESRPHYIFFLELEYETDSQVEAVLTDISKVIDASLCHRHLAYKLSRGKGELGDPHTQVVPRGSFHQLQGYLLENSSATANQIKIPQKLRTTAMVEFMLQKGNRIYR